MVTRSNFLDLQSAVLNGTLSLSMFVTACGLEETAAILGVAGVITAFKAPFNFKQDVLNEIDRVAGYQGQDSHGKSVYSRGCLIVEYMSNGLTFYSVQSWNGTTMYGPEGWTGSWTTNS